MPESWSFGVVALLSLGVLTYGVAKTAMPGAGILAGTLIAAAIGPAAGSGFSLPLLLVGDVIALTRYRRGANWTIIVALLPWVLVGLCVSAAAFATLDRGMLTRFLGALILLSVLLEVRRRRRGEVASVEAPHVAHVESSTLGRRVSVGFYGTLAGMTTLAANAGGAAMSLYLLRMRVPMLAFLGTSAWFWAIINVTKVPFAIPLGLITGDTLRADALFLPFLLAGAALGVWLHPRMSQAFFSAAVLTLSGVASVWLLVHG
ncbi:MAG: TSUP family transporter [Actinobacteria bacterium]|uniref:Unannotated protein n=1 Tax=freshwater metagenome TaxID=449393 RepID=A0A6J7QK81_9ZZZZ|nr:TSUP family transporter [Actinomycetota bacterium]